MNHSQMAEMTYMYLNKAAITAAEADNVVECKKWLQAIGGGQLRITDQTELDEKNEVARQAALKEIGENLEKANGEDASPDGPEGDAAPG